MPPRYSPIWNSRRWMRRGLLLGDPVDPTHLHGQLPLDTLKGPGCGGWRHPLRLPAQKNWSALRVLPLEGYNAVVKRFRYLQRLPGIHRVGESQLLLVQIRAHRHAQQGAQGAERLDPSRQGCVHQTLFLQADEGAVYLPSQVCTTSRSKSPVWYASGQRSTKAAMS